MKFAFTFMAAWVFTACCPATDSLYAYLDGDQIPVPPTRPLDKSALSKHPYPFDNRAGLLVPDFGLEDVDLVLLKKSREFLGQHAQRHPEKPFFLLHSTHAVHLPSFAAKPFQGRTNAGPHGDFIHVLDFIVGELLQPLERLGLADNTVVMFSSDNGSETTSDAHLRADYDHDGAWPYTSHQTTSLALALRQGPWKYLDHRSSGGNNYAKGELKLLPVADTAPDAPGQLYNLENEHGKTTNLSFKHPEKVQALKALPVATKTTGRTRGQTTTATTL